MRQGERTNHQGNHSTTIIRNFKYGTQHLKIDNCMSYMIRIESATKSNVA
jgi:hypothetical protein